MGPLVLKGTPRVDALPKGVSVTFTLERTVVVVVVVILGRFFSST